MAQKRKDKRPARVKYTTGQVWLKNKAKRIFKQMRKFTNYRFPKNNTNNTIKVYVRKLADKFQLDFSKRGL